MSQRITRTAGLTTISGIVSATPGSNIIIAAPGDQRRIKVTSYDLQSAGDCARGYFAAGPSGAQMTPEWELGNREGVVKSIPDAQGSFIFALAAGQPLSFESSSNVQMKYSVTYHADDNF